MKSFKALIFCAAVLLVFANAFGQENKERKFIEKLLTGQMKTYPQMQIQDVYKLLHQASFGSEHAVESETAAREWLMNEVKDLSKDANEPLLQFISPDKKLVRVNLRPYIARNLDLEKLNSAFVKTANSYKGRTDTFIKFWNYAEELAAKKKLPFGMREMQEFFAEQKAKNFPAVHHSEKYEAAYHPAYRVVLLELLNKKYL